MKHVEIELGPNLAWTQSKENHYRGIQGCSQKVEKWKIIFPSIIIALFGFLKAYHKIGLNKKQSTEDKYVYC